MLLLTHLKSSLLRATAAVLRGLVNAAGRSASRLKGIAMTGQAQPLTKLAAGADPRTAPSLLAEAEIA